MVIVKPLTGLELFHDVLFTVLQIASFLLYLSDVKEGGETMFPFEVRSECFTLSFYYRFHLWWIGKPLKFSDVQNDSNMGIGYDYKKCIGLKVKPRRGDGLLFYSLFPNGTIDKVYVFVPYLCISTSMLRIWLFCNK